MICVIQRVKKSNVTVGDQVISQIGLGFNILLGVANEDTQKKADLMAEKIVNLRIMSDENEKMNKSILDVGGDILVISQFTLLADTKDGRRPSFINAAKPEDALQLYSYFIDKLKYLGVKNVQIGSFGKYMSVEITNDGPVTIVLKSEEL